MDAYDQGSNSSKIELIEKKKGCGKKTGCDLETSDKIKEKQKCCKGFISHFDIEMFKTAIIACCKIPDLYAIFNFGRKELNQTGTGHFACLGGYHQES